MVPISEIKDKKNDYNLNIPRYVDSQEEEDIQDIEAHLKGGIPKKDIDDLNNYWEVYPNIRQALFTPSKRKGYEEHRVDNSEIKLTIFDHAEFTKYSETIKKTYLQWKKATLPLLNGIKIGTRPKDLIFKISENILEEFSKLKLIDKYDIYQHMMTYWEDTMQDDLYILAQNGWNTEISAIENAKGKEIGWDSELIPKNIAIDKYFTKQRDTLDNIRTELEGITQQMQTLDEENQGEEDLFSEVRSDADKISKGMITKRLKIIKNDSEFADELKALTEYQDLKDKEAELKKQIKSAELDLDKNLLIKYNDLSEPEIKELVIEDKWLKSIQNLIEEEMERISHKLTRRIKELAERYETPLPNLTKDVQTLTEKVGSHLEKMGFKW